MKKGRSIPVNKTPNSNRISIGIYGKRNTGKSELLNGITEQNVSLVSSIQGTTTDPVKKAMEFNPLGPVLFIDTAGLDDVGELGKLRVEKTRQVMQQSDYAIYVMDINDLDIEEYEKTKAEFKKINIPYLTVINKTDTVAEEKITETKEKFPEAILISAQDHDNILELKSQLIENIKVYNEEPTILGDIIPYNGKVILVVPIDAEAPKGRLILPQVQVIRDCLDNGIKCYTVRDTELGFALQDLTDIDLVITDSQAFKKVAEIVPKSIPLTSFSILFARYKGDLRLLMAGIEKMKNLPDPARILISETCTHNVSCKDIGRVKIPTLLRKHLNKELKIDTVGGQDFPKNIKDYDLLIHCGACMLNRKAMQSRLAFSKEKGVQITNYGMTLAYLNGIFKRATKIFKERD